MGETFTTAKGIKVEFVGIAGLISKLNSEYSGKMPEPPHYDVKGINGVVEHHVHDWTTAETDEEKAALSAYEEKVKALEAERAKKMTQLMWLRGIKVEMPADDAWVKEQEFLGITVPTDPHERRVHWGETEVCGNVDDIEQIARGIKRANGVPEEELQAAGDSFRHTLGQSDGATADGSDPASDGTGVVLQPTVRAGEGGNSDGHSAERVRRTRRNR